MSGQEAPEEVVWTGALSTESLGLAPALGHPARPQASMEGRHRAKLRTGLGFCPTGAFAMGQTAGDVRPAQGRTWGKCMNQRGLPAVPTAQAACSPGNLSLLPWSGCCWLCTEANLQPALKTPQGILYTQAAALAALPLVPQSPLSCPFNMGSKQTTPQNLTPLSVSPACRSKVLLTFYCIVLEDSVNLSTSSATIRLQHNSKAIPPNPCSPGISL